MRPWDQHHARANRDEPEHGTELEPDDNRTDDTGEERGAERLHEQAAAYPRQPPAEAGAGAGAERNQHQAKRVGRAENHAEPCGSRGCHQGKARGRDRRKLGNRLKRRSRRSGSHAVSANLIDQAHRLGNLVHIHSRGLRGEDLAV